jgi:hypothetical protein
MVHDIPNVSLANAELAGECALLPAFAGVSSSNFVHLRLCKFSDRFAPWRVGVFALPRFTRLVMHVSRVRIEPKMRWVHTKLIRTSGALMTNLKALWYRTFAQQPHCTVGRNRPKPLLASAYLSITNRCDARLPQPALVGSAHVHLAPKAVGESARKSLRGEILGSNVFTSHIKLPQPESPYGGTRVLPFVA